MQKALKPLQKLLLIGTALSLTMLLGLSMYGGDWEEKPINPNLPVQYEVHVSDKYIIINEVYQYGSGE